MVYGSEAGGKIMNDMLIFYLTLSVLLLIIVLVSLPTMINGSKKNGKR